MTAGSSSRWRPSSTVPDAVLVLHGLRQAPRGTLAVRWSRRGLCMRAGVPCLDAVPPERAALVVGIRGRDGHARSSRHTENHRYTTPQKLFEAMAAGVPSSPRDLPGIAVRVGAGRLWSSSAIRRRPCAIANALRAHPGCWPADEPLGHCANAASRGRSRPVQLGIAGRDVAGGVRRAGPRSRSYAGRPAI